MLNEILLLDWVVVPAICDNNPGAMAASREIILKHGRGKATEYGKDELDYKRLVERDDLDAVIIATYWQWHTLMAVDAMKMEGLSLRHPMHLCSRLETLILAND